MLKAGVDFVGVAGRIAAGDFTAGFLKFVAGRVAGSAIEIYGIGLNPVAGAIHHVRQNRGRKAPEKK